jgi:hypothetical protein
MTDDSTAPAMATAEADEDEAEAEAIIAVIKALKSLSRDARRRVIGWAAAKYGVTSAVPVPAAAPAGGGNSSERRASAPAVSAEGARDLDAFDDFAELFDAAQPENEFERALTASYWVQHRLKKNPFLSQDANTLLKNLGHQIKDITVPFDAMRARKPSLVIQLKKDGSHQQSRKQYRMTPAGTNGVLDAVQNGGFVKPEAS